VCIRRGYTKRYVLPTSLIAPPLLYERAENTRLRLLRYLPRQYQFIGTCHPQGREVARTPCRLIGLICMLAQMRLV
jgi:hypothetical protein